MIVPGTRSVIHAGADTARAFADAKARQTSPELLELVMRAESAATASTMSQASSENADLKREVERLSARLADVASENRRFLVTCEVLEAENAALRAEIALSKSGPGISSPSEDPRLDALSRAISLDRPLDAYARR